MTQGQRYIQLIKETSRAGSVGLGIKVCHGDIIGWLRPIPTIRGATSDLDVSLLTRWRNLHVKSFLTEFTATDSRTLRWLEDYVHVNDGKILWMLELADGSPVGHLGLGFIDWSKSYGEADAIVSGGRSPKGLMRKALITLLAWSRDTLGITHLAVRVRSDNPALEFYKKTGFVETKRITIRKHSVPDGINWSEDPEDHSGPEYLVYMNWVGEQ